MDIKETHSKLNNNVYLEHRTQEYLKSNNLKNEDKNLLFRIRTRTVENIKTNFRNQFLDNLACRLCTSPEESQQHQFDCLLLKSECKELRENKTVKYEDFFGNVLEQIEAVNLYKKALETRERLLYLKEGSDTQDLQTSP